MAGHKSTRSGVGWDDARIYSLSTALDRGVRYASYKRSHLRHTCCCVQSFDELDTCLTAKSDLSDNRSADNCDDPSKAGPSATARVITMEPVAVSACTVSLA